MKLEKKREIKSNLLEIRQGIIKEVRRWKSLKSEYYLGLPVSDWDEKNSNPDSFLSEIKNKISENEKNRFHIEEVIKNFS